MSSSYSREWFVERAFSSLKKASDGVWDYSDSLLIYVPSGAETYESLQATDTPYHALVTKPEQEYLHSIATDIVRELPDSFDYIDLGPGTEHKEQFFFDAFKAAHKSFTYIPVDISDHFLGIAEMHAKNQGIPTHRLKRSFEELSHELHGMTKPRFVSLGATFSNYQPQECIQLLQSIGGPNGFAFINTQMRDRLNMETLQRIYQDDVSQVMDGKLRLLGLDPDTDLTACVADDGIRVWTTIMRTNTALERIGIKNNDRLLVFQSLRYTKDSLESALQGTKHLFFDTGGSFVGTLIQTNGTR